MERDKQYSAREARRISPNVKVYRGFGRGMLYFSGIMPTDDFNELVAISLEQRRNNLPDIDIVRRQILNQFNERLYAAANQGSPSFSCDVACFEHELDMYKEIMDDLTEMLNSADKNYQARLILETLEINQQDKNRWGDLPNRLLRLSVAAGASSYSPISNDAD